MAVAADAGERADGDVRRAACAGWLWLAVEAAARERRVRPSARDSAGVNGARGLTHGRECGRSGRS